jgi:hypothetical protein
MLIVAEGLASDRYMLVPAAFVLVKKGRTAADLCSGRYSVSKVGAEPVNVGDAPPVAGLIPDPYLERVELMRVEAAGRHAYTRMEGGTFAALFTAGSKVIGVDSEKLGALIEDARPLADRPVQAGDMFGRTSPTVTYTITADPSKPLGPLVVTRERWSIAVSQERARSVYVSARWQALVMPVRVGS